MVLKEIELPTYFTSPLHYGDVVKHPFPIEVVTGNKMIWKKDGKNYENRPFLVVKADKDKIIALKITTKGLDNNPNYFKIVTQNKYGYSYVNLRELVELSWEFEFPKLDAKQFGFAKDKKGNLILTKQTTRKLYNITDKEKEELKPIIEKKFNIKIDESLKEVNKLPYSELNEEIKINDTLNKDLWDDNNELKEEVREKLLDIADAFLDDLKEDGIDIKVEDIRLLGSNANYNYTDQSDLDLHIVAQIDPEKYEQQLYNCYKTIFNNKYDIKIKGREVEVYVEDVNTPAKSNGVYSLYTGWISKPKREEIPTIDYDEFEKLFDEWEDDYFDIIDDVELSTEQKDFPLDEGLTNLKHRTPFMLRRNGEVLDCGWRHPYLVDFLYQYVTGDKIKDIPTDESIIHDSFVEDTSCAIWWYYNNTKNEYAKGGLSAVVHAVLDDDKFGYRNASYLTQHLDEFTAKGNLASDSLADINAKIIELATLFDNEFCRIRVGDEYYGGSPTSNVLYVRVSSQGYNWTDALIKMISDNFPFLKDGNITVETDRDSLGIEKVYELDGMPIFDMPIDTFINYNRKPLIEKDEFKNRIREGYTLWESSVRTHSSHILNYLKVYNKRYLEEDIKNVFGTYRQLDESLKESRETKELDIVGTAGYIKDDGTLIVLDEYHGEDKELQKLYYPEFSNTHPEDDTCIRIYKEPNAIQYKKLEEIIDKYLDREEYCKVEVWSSSKKYEFYEVYSLYEGACQDCSWDEKVGNWTGYKLVNVIKNYFTKQKMQESLKEDTTTSIEDTVLKVFGEGQLEKGPMYLLPNGKLLNIPEPQQIGLGAFIQYKCHACVNAWLLYKKLIPGTLWDMNDETPLLERGWVRGNLGQLPDSQAIMNYIEIPKKKITDAQYKTILRWLDYAQTIGVKSIEVNTEGMGRYKSYSFSDYTSDEIVDKIKKYYATNRLEESINVNILYDKKDLIENLLKEKYEVENFSTQKSSLILKDGTIIQCEFHPDLIDYLCETGKFTEEEMKVFDYYGGEIFPMILGCTRETMDYYYENYLSLPSSCTEAQYRKIIEWLDLDSQYYKYVTVLADGTREIDYTSDGCKEYNYSDYTSDEIVAKIKKYYATGKLEESIERLSDITPEFGDDDILCVDNPKELIELFDMEDRFIGFHQTDNDYYLISYDFIHEDLERYGREYFGLTGATTDFIYSSGTAKEMIDDEVVLSDRGKIYEYDDFSIFVRDDWDGSNNFKSFSLYEYLGEPKQVVDFNDLDESLREEQDKYTPQDVLNNLYLDEYGFEDFSIESRSYPDDYSSDDYFKGIMFKDYNVGNLAYKYDYEKNILYLDGIEIKEPYRSRGLGKKTIELLIKEHPHIKQIRLNAVPSAIDFYKKLGFKKYKMNNMVLNLDSKLEESMKINESYEPWEGVWYRAYNKNYDVFSTNDSYGGKDKYTWATNDLDYLDFISEDEKIAKLKLKPCKLLFYNMSNEEWDRLVNKYGNIGENEIFDTINPTEIEISIMEKEGYDGFIDSSVLYVKKKFLEVIDDNISLEESLQETDNEGNTLSKEQVEFFKNSKVRNDKGNLLEVYHGTIYKFKSFRDNANLNWFSKEKDYAKQFGDDVDSYYLNITNPVNIGEINYYLGELDEDELENEFQFTTEEGQEMLLLIPNSVYLLADTVGCSVEDLVKCYDSWYWQYSSYIDDNYDEFDNVYVMEGSLYNITNSTAFKELIISKGYDGVFAEEGGYETYGIVSPEQVKLCNNTNPTTSKNIDEELSRQDKSLLYKTDNYTKEPKENRIRLYHQTNKDNINSIIDNGLLTDKARPFDNPGKVVWFSDINPFDSDSWNFGNCLIEVDLPNDYDDLHKVNAHEYTCYKDIPKEYINAIYLQSSYVPKIMRDFQNTLSIDKSIERFKKGELNEDIIPLYLYDRDTGEYADDDLPCGYVLDTEYEMRKFIEDYANWEHYKIVYDPEKKFYIVGDPWDSTHANLIDYAIDNGYYLVNSRNVKELDRVFEEIFLRSYMIYINFDDDDPEGYPYRKVFMFNGNPLYVYSYRQKDIDNIPLLKDLKVLEECLNTGKNDIYHETAHLLGSENHETAQNESLQDEGLWQTKKHTWVDWHGNKQEKSYDYYVPKQDTKYKRLIKKPINTLTLDEVIYIDAIYRCWYMQQLIPWQTPEEAVKDTKENYGEELKECYDWLHSLSFPLTIYRGIRVGNFKSSELNSETKDLVISGKQSSLSWTTDINIYKNERSKFRNLTDIVACEIDSNIVDSANTINNFVYYSTGKDDLGRTYGEYEITLKNNFKQSDLHNLRFVDKEKVESLQEAKQDTENFKKWVEQSFRKDYPNKDENTYKKETEDLVNRFESIKKNLKSPQNDYYYWIKNNNLKEFRNFLDDTETNIQSKKEEEDKVKEGAKLLYSDKDWKVYEITNYEASVKYGKGTKWCISGSKRWSDGQRGQEYWNDYAIAEIKFYFFINKDGHKYALSIYPGNEDFEIFNELDSSIGYIPDAPIIEEIPVDYYTKDNYRLFRNLFLSNQLPNNLSERLIFDLFEGDTREIHNVPLEDFVSYIDDDIPDGYLEFDAVADGTISPNKYRDLTGDTYEEGDDWGGDASQVEVHELISDFNLKPDALVNKKILLSELEKYIKETPPAYIVVSEFGTWASYRYKPIEDFSELVLFCTQHFEGEWIKDTFDYLKRLVRDGEVDNNDLKKVGISLLLDESLTENNDNDKIIKLPQKTLNNAIEMFFGDRPYEIKKVSIKQLVDDNELLNDDDLESYHKAQWENKPAKEFSIDFDKLNKMRVSEIPYVVERNNKLIIGDGRHRIRAAYNDGYDFIELPVIKESLLNKHQSYIAYHGSQQSNLSLRDEPIYLTDSKEIATQFANGYAFGGRLLDSDKPTLYEIEVIFNNPRVLKTEEEYDELMDITNIDNTLKLLKNNNQDGLIYTDVDFTYYMPVNAKKQCKIIKETPAVD